MGISQVLTDNKVITAAFPVSTAISRGDLLWYDNANRLAKRASARTDLGSTALNQADFAPIFLGVSMDTRFSAETTSGSVRTSTNSLRDVVTDGVFDLPCASATWKIGDLIGIARDGTNTVNFNQQVVKVSTPNLAIGVCIQEESVATTTVRGRLIGTVATEPHANLTRGIGNFQGQGINALTDGAQTLTVDSAPFVTMTPTADRVITLPAVGQSTGLAYWISNLATNLFYLSVKNAGGTLIGVVGPGETSMFGCDGATWKGIISETGGLGNMQVPSSQIVSKTADYTVLVTDSGTMFDNTGAAGSVNFTLPAVANAKGFYAYIFGVVDQQIVVTAPAGTLVGPNNAGRTSYTSGAAGQRIGAVHYVYCNGAKYFLALSLQGLTQGAFA